MTKTNSLHPVGAHILGDADRCVLATNGDLLAVVAEIGTVVKIPARTVPCHAAHCPSQPELVDLTFRTVAGVAAARVHSNRLSPVGI